jgi:hypothetical protein
MARYLSMLENDTVKFQMPLPSNISDETVQFFDQFLVESGLFNDADEVCVTEDIDDTE